jgi:hypothetical protein
MFYLRQGLSNCFFTSGIPIKIFHEFLKSPKRATCPAHLILLDFTAVTLLGAECNYEASHYTTFPTFILLPPS